MHRTYWQTHHTLSRPDTLLQAGLLTTVRSACEIELLARGDSLCAIHRQKSCFLAINGGQKIYMKT